MFELKNDQEFAEYLKACSNYANIKAYPVKKEQGLWHWWIVDREITTTVEINRSRVVP